MEMLNNAMAYFSPPSTPRKSVMQFFENINPLNSFKTDAEIQMPSSSNQEDKAKQAPKNPLLTPKSAAAAFNFSNNSIAPATTSAYPTTISPSAIVLEKPPKGRGSRPLSMIMGKKKPPPPLPCDASVSTEAEEENHDIDPEVLAVKLAKVCIVEEPEESPALFPPIPPKPQHLSRSSSIKPVIPTVDPNGPPPIPPKTYKKSYGYSS